MIIAKIGGSLLAPKQSQGLDMTYCTQFFDRRKKQTQNNNCILVHGVGNIGHGFVNQYGLDASTYLLGRQKLFQMYHTIDSLHEGTRIRPDELGLLRSNTSGQWIIGGDIMLDWTISSGDDQFPTCIRHTNSTQGYMFTDVPGVLDEHHEIIPVITRDTITTVAFRETNNDVTGGMRGKIEKLFAYILDPCVIWICSGRDFENMSSILQTGQGKGTKVIIA